MHTVTLENGQTALWTIPDVRSDREHRLAKLLVAISMLDSLDGCYAGNKYFKEKILGGQNESSVRRGNQKLAECGLIAIELRHGRDRTIRPLVPLGDVLRAGWLELAHVVMAWRRMPKEMKRLAGMTLKQFKTRFCDLKKLGVEPEAKQKKREKCTSNKQSIARVNPLKERSEKATAIVHGTPGIQEVPEPAATHDPAAASLLEKLGGLIQAEAISLAISFQKMGATIEHIRSACKVMATRNPAKIQSKSGYLYGLVQRAMSGQELSLSLAPASHPSDLGIRPEARPHIDRAPAGFEKRWAARLKSGPTDKLEAALAALGEAERTQLIDSAVEAAAKLVIGEKNKEEVRRWRETDPKVREILRNWLGL